MDGILNELNEEQLRAVKTTEGYIRVIAGAGSGKTKTLTTRYAYLVKKIGISPRNILCVTFTNKAANEMKKRVRKIIGDMDTSMICTFHSFCVHVLREDIHVLNYPKNFIILDEEDIESILRNVYEKLEINSSYKNFYDAKKDISFYKSSNNNKYIKELTTKEYQYIKEQYENNDLSLNERIIYGYLYEQRKCFGLDFDDLILFTLYIYELRKDILEKWQKQLTYVMVDEFQDVSSRQNNLCELLTEYHKNLFIVGDPDQTIYSWRGAKVDYILNFENIHPNCQSIILNRNYRSTSNILNAANSLISKNKCRVPKDLITLNQDNIPVIYNHTKSIQDEAKWISQEIKNIIDKGYKYSDIAILYRAHYISRAIEQTFIQENINYTIYNGVEFFKRKEIKDVLSYLRMITSSDDLSFQRIINIPKRNFGKKRLDFIKEYATKNNISLYEALKQNLNCDLILNTQAKEFVELIEKYKKIYINMKVSDIFNCILVESGYEEFLRTLSEDERIENISELKNTIIEFENKNQEDTSLDEYLKTIALYTDIDAKKEKDEVKLMTVHSAKGLEFPFVFVCSLNEGIFPSSKVNTMEELEEERRLAYVAFTRAQKALFLSDAEGYTYDKQFRYPSRFIFNVGKNNLNYLVELDDSLIEETRSAIEEKEDNYFNQKQLFNIGDRIKHEVLGIGTIISVDTQKNDYEIIFDNSKTTRNIRFTGPITKYFEENKNTKNNKINEEFIQKENINLENDNMKNNNKIETKRKNFFQRFFK